MVYDQCLKAKRPLMEIAGVSSGIYLFTHYDGDTTWLLSRNRKVKSQLNEFTLNIHNDELRIIKSDTINTSQQKWFLVISANKKLYATQMGSPDQIHEVGMGLRSTPVYQHQKNIHAIRSLDIENDGKEEFFITTLNSDLIYILSHDFKHKTEVRGKIGKMNSLLSLARI